MSIKSKYLQNWQFGFKREEVIERDGGKCTQCKMTRIEHYQRWNCDITVDHIDGNGRNKKASEKNNDVSNLQTLCLICHGKKDSVRRKNYETQSKGERHHKSKLTWDDVDFLRKSKLNSVQLSKILGVDYTHICKIRRNELWKIKV